MNLRVFGRGRGGRRGRRAQSRFEPTDEALERKEQPVHCTVRFGTRPRTRALFPFPFLVVPSALLGGARRSKCLRRNCSFCRCHRRRRASVRLRRGMWAAVDDCSRARDRRQRSCDNIRGGAWKRIRLVRSIQGVRHEVITSGKLTCVLPILSDRSPPPPIQRQNRTPHTPHSSWKSSLRRGH